MSTVSAVVDRIVTNRQYQFWILFIISAILIFSSLGKGGLSGYDDAVFASYGKQMILSGDWWNLRLNGNLMSELPPMFPWVEAISMKIFGITDFAAKFPAALLGLLAIALTYFLTKELFDNVWMPLLAMAVMSSTQYFLKYTMHAMTDVPFTFFFVLSLYLYLKGLKKPGYFWLSGVAIGAAILTRSVFGLIPLGMIFLHILVTRKHRLFWSKHLAGMVVISIALPVIWYGSQSRTHGSRFLKEHFSFVASKIGAEETGMRSDSRGGIVRTVQGIVGYPKLILRHYWPWLPLMLIGLVIQVKAFIRSRESGAALLLIWVICVLIPLSIPEAKVLRYIMPVFPAFAMLAAVPLSRWADSARSAPYIKWGYLVILVALLLAALIPKPKLRAEDMQTLAPIIDANSNPRQHVYIYTYGEVHYNYINQLLWYSGRYYLHLTKSDALRDTLLYCRETVAVIDRQTFDQMSSALGKNIKVLGESRNFVCLKSN